MKTSILITSATGLMLFLFFQSPFARAGILPKTKCQWYDEYVIVYQANLKGAKAKTMSTVLGALAREAGLTSPVAAIEKAIKDIGPSGDVVEVVIIYACTDLAGVTTRKMYGRYEVAVFNVGGEFYALENTCPHQGGPLAEGWLEESRITCPWRGWCFDVRTGKMTLGEFARVPQFEVQRGGRDLLIATEPGEWT